MYEFCKITESDITEIKLKVFYLEKYIPELRERYAKQNDRRLTDLMNRAKETLACYRRLLRKHELKVVKTSMLPFSFRVEA